MQIKIIFNLLDALQHCSGHRVSRGSIALELGASMWRNVEMENVFCKLKTENEKVLSAYRIAWQDKFFPSIWYRLNVEWWMLNRMNGWTNECECVNSEWVSEWVCEQGNQFANCAHGLRSKCFECEVNIHSETGVCVCVPAGVYECVCVWVCRQIIAWTLHKPELQLRKSIPNQFVIGPWRGAWSDEFKHFFVSLCNTAQHTIKVDYLWNVYN